MQIKLKRPVSLDDAIKHLTKKRKKGTKISDLAGTWDMTDEEAAEMEGCNREIVGELDNRRFIQRTFKVKKVCV